MIVGAIDALTDEICSVMPVLCKNILWQCDHLVIRGLSGLQRACQLLL